MANLQKFLAKLCYTSSGMLIIDNKVLLIKHKKLGFWLNPGGHIEENELPHQAVEREFFEETGIKVKTVNFGKVLDSGQSEYVPTPILTNLHWISRENYNKRLTSTDKTKRIKTKKWFRGCEQHLVYIFLVKPIGSLRFKRNAEETDGIAWFSLEELEDLETTENIKNEIKYAFELNSKLKH